MLTGAPSAAVAAPPTWRLPPHRRAAAAAAAAAPHRHACLPQRRRFGHALPWPCNPNSGSCRSSSGVHASSSSTSTSSSAPDAAAAPLRLPDCIYPWDPRFRSWSALVTAAAALSGILIPWEVAFMPAAELYSLHSPLAAINLALVGLFGADLALSFRLAYFEGERLVEDRPSMARHYLAEGGFWIDLLGAIPADWMLLGVSAAAAAATAAGGGGDGDASAASAALLQWLPLLRLLHLARLYRVR